MSNEFVMVPREVLSGLVEYADGLLSDCNRAWSRAGRCAEDDTHMDQDYLTAVTLLAQPAEQHQREPVEAAVFNDPLYNAESDARNASSLLEEVLEWFDDGVGRSQAEFKLMRKIGAWLGRSVPSVDGGSDECAHSYASKIGCPECGEEFGAEPSAPVEIDHDALVAAVCVLRSQGLNNLSAAVEEARAALERKP